MASLPLTSRSGLERALVAHQRGTRDARGEVTLVLRTGVALATVSVRKNQLHALVGRVRDVFGLDFFQARKCVIAGPLAFVWAGAGQWLAMEEGADGAALQRRLRIAMGNLASICDQSDGRIIIRVSGERARDVLAKGVPIDLHPRAFRPDDVAVTSAGHIGVQIWQVDETPTYELIVSRSFAVSFWEWLTESAAEFGYRIADMD